MDWHCIARTVHLSKLWVTALCMAESGSAIACFCFWRVYTARQVVNPADVPYFGGFAPGCTPVCGIPERHHGMSPGFARGSSLSSGGLSGQHLWLQQQRRPVTCPLAGHMWAEAPPPVPGVNDGECVSSWVPQGGSWHSCCPKHTENTALERSLWGFCPAFLEHFGQEGPSSPEPSLVPCTILQQVPGHGGGSRDSCNVAQLVGRQVGPSSCCGSFRVLLVAEDGCRP